MSLYVAWGVAGAYRLTRVVEVDVPCAGLHPDLDGLRIVQLSDLHIGPGIRRAQVARVAHAVQELRPELVVFTGDLADGLPGDLGPEAAPPADFKLLLAHQPLSVFAAEQAGYDLMLSGHTHGGQYHPYTWLAGKANPYLKGLNRHSARLQVYVSQGTGFWGPPIRVGTAPEITLLSLRRR